MKKICVMMIAACVLAVSTANVADASLLSKRIDGVKKIATDYPETAEAYVRQDGITRFCCDLEITLCGGYSDEEYSEDFRKALHLLTKDAVPDFKVSLNLYYLEHEPDFEVEYDRQELAA